MALESVFQTKIARAEHIFDELGSQIGHFARSSIEPYRDRDAETGETVFRARIPEQPSLTWSVFVGDIAHNLRSALDLLACELVRANGEEVIDSTAFPISKDHDGLIRATKRHLRGASERSIAAIHGLDGDHTGLLWRLDQLDFLNNRQEIITIAMVIHFRAKDPVLNLHADLEYFSHQRAYSDDLGPWPGAWYALSDGMELYRVSASDDERYKNPQFFLDAIFSKVDGFAGYQVEEHIGMLINGTKDVCERLKSTLHGHQILPFRSI